ncbi:MAG: hypothetical protein WCF61_17280 [Terriglobales bacterium]
MLRITVEEKDDLTNFRLEGKLTGDWVKELERCWIRAKHIEPGTQFTVDLSGVNFVDEKGKTLLESMVSEGAGLQAEGPMMRLLVDTIVENAHCGGLHNNSAEESLPSDLLLGE